MAISEERITAVRETVPLNDEDIFMEEHEDVGGCGCFRGRGRYLLKQELTIRESWLRERVKGIKEFSEVVAGPKWKTFIRRLSAVTNNKKRSKMQFHYDPQSYKLNFDDGIHGEAADDGHVDFWARVKL